MARPIRIQYPGAVYHVMARGNHGQAVFGDHADRRRFLETLGEACEKTGWRVHAYVLMGNHYHLLPEGYWDGALEGRRRESHSGQAKGAHDEAAAQKALQAALGALGLSESRLERMPKSAPEKRVLAWWLRQRTTVPLRWVSEHLAMGHFTRVSQATGQVKRRPGRKHERIKRLLSQGALQQTTP